MGIQVTVSLKDLPEAFKVEHRDKEVFDNRCDLYIGEHCDYCQGAGCVKTIKELRVKFPKSGWLVSYLDDAIVFDNKYSNDQFREELEEHNVPFTRC